MVMPASSGLRSNSQTSVPVPSGTRTMHSLVILGASAPLLATARRAMHSAKIHLIDIVRGPKISHRHLEGIEPGKITINLSQVHTPEGLALIRSFAEKVQADALLTDDDWVLAVLARNRSLFEPASAVLVPDYDMLLRLWDKAYQVRLAEQCGFDVLPTYMLHSADDIATIPDDVFPAVLRPSYLNSAQPAFKARVLASHNEMSAFYASTTWTHPPIVQRFCLGPNLVLNGVRAQSGKWLGLRLFNVYRKYHGFSVSMKPLPLPAAMDSAARRFVEAAGLTGPFHFEFLASPADNKAYFLEINCRLGGTTGKVIELGFDEPGLLFTAFNIANAQPLPPLRAHRRVTSLRLNLTQAWNDLRNRRDPLAYPRLPRAQSIAAALKESLLVHHG